MHWWRGLYGGVVDAVFQEDSTGVHVYVCVIEEYEYMYICARAMNVVQ